MSPVVRIKRLELLRPHEHQILSLAWLPITTYPHIKLSAFLYLLLYQLSYLSMVERVGFEPTTHSSLFLEKSICC